ncbi:thioredoxin domain-containing protein 11-like [Plakobranchus ocellatus]|uniref:Thioredoxin domain-containing protein 11-like n=1 Tax=Plakobranchus ocellatus TaxID=259542 RepID=A0AAV4BHZ8_9GAST|nr:thioredoxin domain-containing protein 11-like [Plakobranchus ocellatus]
MADEVSRTTQSARIIGFIKRPDDFLRAMARHPQLCCLFMTFLTSFILEYVCSSKGKPMVLPARSPQLMFPSTGPVEDAPLGSLGSLIQKLQEEDLVVVLYYAPWCSKSRAARAEYLKAAYYFQGMVQFAAVNCWWPEGECRKRYKFLMFPVMMVYHTKLDGYRYFDVFRAEHIVKFVESLLHPLSIAHSKKEITGLMARHDTVVFGYFNLSSEEHIGGYRQFFYASMRIIEKDPVQPIHLAVVAQAELALQLGLTDEENIVLCRVTNTSMMYPFGKNITSSNIVRWALRNKGQGIVTRLSPEGLKSKALATEINKGPAFILFHVEDPLFDTELALSMVRDLALLYNSCKLHPLVKSSRQTLVELAERARQRYQQLSRSCATLKAGLNTAAQHRHTQTVTCCMSVLVAALNDSTSICSLCCPGVTESSCGCVIQALPWLWGSNNTSSGSNRSSSRLAPLSCRNMLLNYSNAGRLSVCCRGNNSKDASSDKDVKDGLFSRLPHGVWHKGSEFSAPTDWQQFERRPTDRYVREHLEVLPKRLCNRLSLERMQGVAPSAPSSLRLDPFVGETVPSTSHFSLLGCRAERPLRFYSIDLLNHWMFSDVLGVESGKNRSGPAVVLVDKEREQHFVLKDNVTLLNAMSFILDFELGKLERHQNSHSFNMKSSRDESSISVLELNTTSFQQILMDDEKDVVLLLYAHWCGFCHTFSHTFLALAQYFSPSNITFARINGAVNDLPWQFTFTSYPVVMFFPAKRKADSVIFPPYMTRNLPSLVKFILKHAQPSTCLLHAADMCSRDCVLRNLRQGRKLLQELTRKSTRLQARLHSISGTIATAEGQTLSSFCASSIGSNTYSSSEHSISGDGDGSSSSGSCSSDTVNPSKDLDGTDSMKKVKSGKDGLAGNEKKTYYSCMNIEYLKKRLHDIWSKMDTLKKMIQLLQSSEGGPISKLQLLHLM